MKFINLTLSVVICYLAQWANSLKYNTEIKKLVTQYGSDKKNNGDDFVIYNPNAPQLNDMANQHANNKTNVTYPEKKNVYVPKLVGDLYWQGWIKYFHYDFDNALSAPKSFYENPDFFTQTTKDSNYFKKLDNLGHRINIPGKNYFWAKLLSSHNLNILGSRKKENNPGAHLIENLNTDLIEYINFDDNANGAIKDLGTFHEGSCIRVNTNVPEAKKDPSYNSRTSEGNKQTWVICTDNKDQKNFLMEYLIAVKLQRQKDIDDVLSEVNTDTKKLETAGDIMGPIGNKPIEKHYQGPDASKDDGFWILLQNWSECSVKCGGGKQTQQWICVPPRNKGKPCMGESVIHRDCNPQACPTAQLGNQETLVAPAPAGSVTLDPVYKALPFSKRPQQYIKCVVKESDILYKTKKFDPQGKVEAKVPARMIMNTKTIAVYTDDTFNNALFTFNLPDTVIAKSTSDSCCFYIMSANRQYEICGFNNNCGTTTNPIWVNQWTRDFDYFQQRCYRELNENELNIKPPSQILADTTVGLRTNNGPTNRVSLEISALPGTVGSSSMQQPQDQLVEGRKSVIEETVQTNQQTELEKKVGETQKTTLWALRREVNLEDMIKDEETQKGEEEAQQLNFQLQQEKKKKSILKKALLVRESNYEQVRQTKQTQLQMDEVKNEAKIEIKFKRAVLKKKLEEIKKKYKRKSRLIQQQIQLVRSEEAEMIMDANRKGDQEKCRITRSDMKKINTYCDNAFSDSVTQNKSCKEPDSFCYTCCEHEFGNLYLGQRDDCQSMCDNLEKQDIEDGDWVWDTGASSENVDDVKK